MPRGRGRATASQRRSAEGGIRLRPRTRRLVVDGHSAWASRFAGLDLRILADHDDPGRDLAAQAALDLAGHAASLRVIAWPDVIEREPPAGYDIGDWLLEHANARSAE